MASPLEEDFSTPTPPIWQGRARGGENAAILGRNPDGTFQVSLNGVEKTFTEPNLAGMLDMRKGPLHAMLGQATQQQLAQPRTHTTPPIWQGRGLNGDPVSVLSRNHDGTFQIPIGGWVVNNAFPRRFRRLRGRCCPVRRVQGKGGECGEADAPA